MKTIKRLAVLIMAAVAVLCIGIFASACTKTTDYTATIYYSDGTTVVDGTQLPLFVQICDAKGGVCYDGLNADVTKDGKATFNIKAVDDKADLVNNEHRYVLHVWDNTNPDDPQELELKSEAIVSADENDIKIILKNVAAPAK